MAQTLPIQLMTQFHEIAKRVAGDSLSSDAVAATLQALIEKQPLELSSLGSKVIDICEGVAITEAFLAQTMTYNGQLLQRHRNGGGWVPADQDAHDVRRPFVAKSVYVGPFAMVFEDARVYDTARVSDSARVFGKAHITDDVQVFDSAEVSNVAHIRGSAQIFDNARVFGNARVSDNARVFGNAWVCEDALVYHDARVFGDARVLGNAQVYLDAQVSGNVQVTGHVPLPDEK